MVDTSPNETSTGFAWTFPEFHRHERTQNWYRLTGLLVFVLVLFSIWTRNFLFGLIVVISALILTLFQRTNRDITCRITDDGVEVNGVLHPFKSLKSFYVIYEPPTVKMLYIEPKSIFNPRIPISLEDQNPLPIREFLLQYLEEDIERENEPLSEQLARLLKL